MIRQQHILVAPSCGSAVGVRSAKQKQQRRMSEVTAENQYEVIPEETLKDMVLGAAEVEPVTGKADFHLELTLYEWTGTAHVRWQIPSGLPLWECLRKYDWPSGTFVHLWATGDPEPRAGAWVLHHNGVWDTKQHWGSGLFAVLYGSDFESQKTPRVVVTPVTKK
jgi:hypothetical protein